MMEKRLLFVDDEVNILRSLKRSYYSDPDIQVFTAEGGSAGLQFLAETPVDIVISDLRMPEMSGLEFLQQVRDRYPHITRIILSGRQDENEIFQSLIDGTSNLYLFKPWDVQEFKLKISQMFETRKVFDDPALLEIANKLENLSLVTGLYDAVVRRVRQDAPVADIARIIERDPAVTAAVLRIVNSSSYNIKTGSIAQAISYLGLSVIQTIVLSCSLFQFAKIQVPPFSSARLTHHANISNQFMKKIYTELLDRPIPDHLSTAGILHNLGLVICLHYFPEKYRRIIQTSAESSGGITAWFLPLEKEILSISHSALGGYLLQWWGIPYGIVECALYHHDPLNPAIVDKEAVAGIHLANYYAWKTCVPDLAIGLEPKTFSILGIDQLKCEQLFQLR